MKGLAVIVGAFAVVAYDLSYNDGQIMSWLMSLIGVG
jgi:hypothetical protein